MRKSLSFYLNLALVLLLCSVAQVSAAPIEQSDIIKQADRVRHRQLKDLSEAMYPGQNSWFYLNYMSWPSPRWMQMEIPYGTVQGYPQHQRFGLVLVNPIDSGAFGFGFSYQLDHFGWDTEQLLSDRERAKFSQMYNMHNFGLFFTQSDWDVLLAGGILWEKLLHNSKYGAPAEDTLYVWTRVNYGPLNANVHWNPSYLGMEEGSGKHALGGRIGLELEHKPLRRQKEYKVKKLKAGKKEVKVSKWQYLPNFYVNVASFSSSMESEELENNLELQYLQNLWEQRIYFLGSTALRSDGMKYGILRAHTDGSRMVTFDLSYWHLAENRNQFGFAVEVPFLRVSYGHPEDAALYPGGLDYSSGLKNGQEKMWRVSIVLDLGAIQAESYYKKHASRPAELEETQLKDRRKKSDWNSPVDQGGPK